MGKYVYLTESLKEPDRHYVGLTSDVEQRLSEHNSGKSLHTAKYSPWKLVVSIWFENDQNAVRFEKYLKHGSGHAFAKKHFW